jgi:methionyl-tRNA formyltransferase
MRIVVLTQEDRVAIPLNVLKLGGLSEVEILLIGIIDSKGALVNKKAFFIRGFGLFQAVLMGISLFKCRLLDVLDRLTLGKILNRPYSLYAVSRRLKARFRRIGNPNELKIISELKNLEPDLVVSFSAPCVFKPDLLAVPRLGCVNLHCSLLPVYAGLFPSFWVLFHEEKVTGATVHLMDDKIDNGGILAQRSVSIDHKETILGVIQKTKSVGGDLMVEVVKRLISGRLGIEASDNCPASYFTWPSLEEIRKFRSKGGRLI